METAAEAEIARRRRQQSALAELGQAALTGVDVTILVGQTCALVEWVLGTSYVSVLEFTGGAWKLRFGVGTDETFSACNDDGDEHRPLLLYALIANEPVVFTNPAADPRLRGDHLVAAHGVEAGACVPIRIREGFFGVLTAYTNERRQFAPDEIDFLRAVADVSGAMIASAENEEARRRAEVARAQSEDRFRALVENSSEGIALVDARGNFLYTGPSTQRLLGYPNDSLIGRNFAELVHPSELEHARRRLRELLEADGNEARGELRLLHAGGGYIWMEGVYKNLLFNQSVRAIVINYRDVTERKLAEQQLETLAYRDSLTDLPNRFLFHDRLEHAMEQARRRERGLAVMYIDLDRFKVVNDTLGHAAGDKLLQVVGRRLRDALRVDDTIARLGGDEFAVITPDVERAEDAGGIGRKLLQVVRTPIVVDGHELHVTASIGISMFPTDGEDVGTLLKHADAALYRSKDAGRNTVRLFATSMNARYTERLELELSLHRAVDRGEFELLYQPIVDRVTRRVRSFEALIRWNRPGHGVVSPSDFIKLAEETRLIIPIGAWALRAACAQLAQWRAAGLPHFHVAVNLSAHEITQPNFIHDVHAVLQENGLAPADLELEVTESAAMQNLEWTLSVLDALRTLGVKIAVDDFGTGQSSFVYLKRLPLHTLKINREFLRDVQRDNDTAILASIIQLGHSLGLYVIAEGIETEVEQELVETQGADAMQGYLFSKPMRASDVEAFVRRFDESATDFAVA
ncbi:MAG TPA: EAL domain-containing protein [Thermoanaerobaculia bacterium]|nr:EAL domain-containing protein [Thermoanaerobaculia bacterium]